MKTEHGYGRKRLQQSIWFKFGTKKLPDGGFDRRFPLTIIKCKQTPMRIKMPSITMCLIKCNGDSRDLIVGVK